MNDTVDVIVEKIRLHLKIIGTYGSYPLEKQVKLYFDYEGNPYCQEETKFSGTYRFFNGDSRYTVLRFVNELYWFCKLVLLVDRTRYESLLKDDICAAQKGIERLSIIYRHSNISEKFKLISENMTKLITLKNDRKHSNQHHHN
jgi:hypothetical protein